MANAKNYKGYRYSVTAGSAGKSPYSPAVYQVSRKRGTDVEDVHTGKVAGTFDSPQDAIRAAHEAARAWIDKRGDDRAQTRQAGAGRQD